MLVLRFGEVQNFRMDVGEIWAYRKTAKSPVEEVRIIRIGVKKPLRVKVRFEDYEAEESEEWIPPGRLKVLWTDREGFLAKELRWRLVDTATLIPPDSEVHTASWVLGTFAQAELRAYSQGRFRTITVVSNVEALSAKTGMTVSEMEQFEHSFWEDGCLVVPWEGTYKFTEALVKANPDAVLRAVLENERRIDDEKRERQLQYHWAHGVRQAEEHDEVERQSMEIQRKWIGEDIQTGHRRLDGALAEIERLRGLVEWAIKKLDHYGHQPSSATLTRYLDGRPESQLTAADD